MIAPFSAGRLSGRSAFGTTARDTVPPPAAARLGPGPVFGGGLLAGGALLGVFLGLAGCAPQEELRALDKIQPAVEAGDSHAVGAGVAISRELSRPMAGDRNVRSMIARALTSQDAVSEAAGKVEALLDNVRVAKAGYYPSVSVGVSSGIGDYGDDDDPALTLTGTQMLYDFGKVDRTVAKSAIAVRSQHLKFLNAVDGLIVDVVQNYSDLRQYREQEAVTFEQLEKMKEIEEMISSRLSEGLSDSSDLLEVRKRAQSAEASYLKTKVELARAQRGLGTLAGSASLRTAGEVPGLPQACASGVIWPEAVPDVQIAHLEKAAAELALRDASKARMPVLSLQGKAIQPFDGNDEDQRLGLNLDLSSTIFQGGSQGAQKAAAEKSLRSADAAVAARRQDAELTFSNAVDEARNLAVVEEALAKQVDYLDEMRVLYRSQFIDLGTRRLIDLLDTEEEYYQTRLDLVSTRYQIESAQITCLESGGRLRQNFGLEDKTLHGLALKP